MGSATQLQRRLPARPSGTGPPLPSAPRRPSRNSSSGVDVLVERVRSRERALLREAEAVVDFFFHLFVDALDVLFGEASFFPQPGSDVPDGGAPPPFLDFFAGAIVPRVRGAVAPVAVGDRFEEDRLRRLADLGDQPLPRLA